MDPRASILVSTISFLSQKCFSFFLIIMPLVELGFYKTGTFWRICRLRSIKHISNIRRSHRCSIKKVFSKISQNSRGNTCARIVSFLITLLKKGLWHRCFPVNFAKILKTFLTEHLLEIASETMGDGRQNIGRYETGEGNVEQNN